MQVTISGKQIDIGEALQNHVHEELSACVKKYFEFAVSANVVFSTEKKSHLFRADIRVNEGTGNKMVVKAEGKETEIYRAFDIALEKVEKQLRRYKRRIKNHHKTGHADLHNQYDAMKYVLSPGSEEEEVGEEDNPLIIAEKATTIETLTVGDAVMRMDLGNLPALMFINRTNGNINVVYRRHDGNIAWVDPRVEQAKRHAS